MKVLPSVVCVNSSREPSRGPAQKTGCEACPASSRSFASETTCARMPGAVLPPDAAVVFALPGAGSGVELESLERRNHTTAAAAANTIKATTIAAAVLLRPSPGPCAPEASVGCGCGRGVEIHESLTVSPYPQTVSLISLIDSF